MSRREQIEAMLADEPGDIFLRYSLSRELYKEGELERSLQLLAELMREEPPYVPAFFMAAQQLVASQRNDEAEEMLRRGIEAARSQGDAHAAAEMSELLMQLAREP